MFTGTPGLHRWVKLRARRRIWMGWRWPWLLEEEDSLPGPSARILTVEDLLFEKAGPGPEVHPN